MTRWRFLLASFSFVPLPARSTFSIWVRWFFMKRTLPSSIKMKTCWRTYCNCLWFKTTTKRLSKNYFLFFLLLSFLFFFSPLFWVGITELNTEYGELWRRRFTEFSVSPFGQQLLFGWYQGRWTALHQHHIMQKAAEETLCLPSHCALVHWRKKKKKAPL